VTSGVSLSAVRTGPDNREVVRARGSIARPVRVGEDQAVAGQGAAALFCAGRASGAPLTLETTASPAGLTAGARPEARPKTRAANL